MSLHSFISDEFKPELDDTTDELTLLHYVQLRYKVTRVWTFPRCIWIVFQTLLGVFMVSCNAHGND